MSPALWRIQTTKAMDGASKQSAKPLLIFLMDSVTGVPEPADAEAEESDCRVILWDAKRKLIATIDNRELRW